MSINSNDDDKRMLHDKAINDRDHGRDGDNRQTDVTEMANRDIERMHRIVGVGRLIGKILKIFIK